MPNRLWRLGFSSPPGLLTFGAKNLNLRSSEIFSQTHGERVLSLAEKHAELPFERNAEFATYGGEMFGMF